MQRAMICDQMLQLYGCIVVAATPRGLESLVVLLVPATATMLKVTNKT